MRKTFLIAFTITTLLALAIGGAYTWTTSTTRMGQDQFRSGTITAAITDVEGTGNLLYPRGMEESDYIPLLTGLIQNTTAANPGVDIHATEGIGAVVDVPPLGVHCHILGWALSFDDTYPIAPGAKGDRWYASFAMPENAGNECMNQAFDALITVNVST
jgi:hypothetical protein